MREPLPSSTLHAIRSCAVPPHLAATLARLPRPLSLACVLPPEGARLGLAARQWLKLALRGEGVVLSAHQPGPAFSMVLSLGDRHHTLDDRELGGDLRDGIPAPVLSLLDSSDVGALLGQLGYATSSLATLRRVTTRMLATNDVGAGYRLLLRGVTAGFGLGFHRAAAFALEGDALRGIWAEGHADEDEAHRVWESLELEEVDIERTLDDAIETPSGVLATRVYSRTLALDHPGVERVLCSRGALWLEPDELPHPIDGAHAATHAAPLAAVPLRARGEAFGVVFADDRWEPSGHRASERLQLLELFADQASLVIDNLRLFERALGLSRTDPLTGLGNRRELEARLALLTERAQRSAQPLGLVICDVDHFKRINDEDGHQAGDELLRRLARVLARSVRSEDSIGRFGGDEFVLLLPEADADTVRRIVHRLGREARADGLSISIGAAVQPADGTTQEELFAAADRALYRSKHAGRGCGHVGAEPIAFDATPRD